TTEYLVELAQPEKVWALGETGLDYYHSTDFVEEQKACFARHIHASQITKKPVVVHTRAAKHDTVDIIRAEKSTNGNLHYFTKNVETAICVVEWDYYFAFSLIFSVEKAQ